MFRRYRHYQREEFIVVGVDTATGGTDYCAAQFLSKTHLDVPVVYHSKKLATEMTPLLHTELETIHDETGLRPVVAYERNNGGVFEMERLATLNRLNKYKLFSMPRFGDVEKKNPIKIGWDTNSATRPKMIADLKDAVDKQVLTLYDRKTIEEMFSFIVVQTSSTWKAQAERNANDDLVMSLAIAWQLYQSENPEKQNMSQARNAINRARKKTRGFYV